MTKFRNVGALTDLADGSICEPRADVTLTKDAQADAHNAALIESGHLVTLDSLAAAEATTTVEEVNDAEAGS